MKKYLFLSLFFITSWAHGQSGHTRKPAHFLDGVNYGTSLPLFNQELIQSVNVSSAFEDKANHLFGALYVTSKRPGKFNFLGVKNILSTFKVSTNGPIIYMLNKEFSKEAENFKIDSSYIYKVEVIKGSEFDYLKNSAPNLSIVKIYTDTKENWPSSELRIRGSASKE